MAEPKNAALAKAITAGMRKKAALAAAAKAEADLYDLGSKTVADITADLEAARKAAVAAVASLPDGWEATQAKAVLAEVEAALAKWELAAKSKMGPAIDAALAQGAGMAPGALAAGGIELVAQPYVSTAVLGAAYTQSALLISDVALDTIRAIDRDLRQGALAQASPFELIGKIGPKAGAGRFGTALARAEAIVRTELGRVHSVANHATMRELAKDQPGLGKEWLSAHDVRVRPDHAKANGQKQPVDEPFTVGGEKLLYPRDPRGSARQTVHCRCISAPTHPDWDDPDLEQKVDDLEKEVAKTLGPALAPAKAVPTPPAPPKKVASGAALGAAIKAGMAKKKAAAKQAAGEPLTIADKQALGLQLTPVEKQSLGLPLTHGEKISVGMAAKKAAAAATAQQAVAAQQAAQAAAQAQAGVLLTTPTVGPALAKSAIKVDPATGNANHEALNLPKLPTSPGTPPTGSTPSVQTVPISQIVFDPKVKPTVSGARSAVDGIANGVVQPTVMKLPDGKYAVGASSSAEIMMAAKALGMTGIKAYVHGAPPASPFAPAPVTAPVSTTATVTKPEAKAEAAKWVDPATGKISPAAQLGNGKGSWDPDYSQPPAAPTVVPLTKIVYLAPSTTGSGAYYLSELQTLIGKIKQPGPQIGVLLPDGSIGVTGWGALHTLKQKALGATGIELKVYPLKGGPAPAPAPAPAAPPTAVPAPTAVPPPSTVATVKKPTAKATVDSWAGGAPSVKIADVLPVATGTVWTPQSGAGVTATIPVSAISLAGNHALATVNGHALKTLVGKIKPPDGPYVIEVAPGQYIVGSYNAQKVLAAKALGKAGIEVTVYKAGGGTPSAASAPTSLPPSASAPLHPTPPGVDPKAHATTLLANAPKNGSEVNVVDLGLAPGVNQSTGALVGVKEVPLSSVAVGSKSSLTTSVVQKAIDGGTWKGAQWMAEVVEVSPGKYVVTKNATTVAAAALSGAGTLQVKVYKPYAAAGSVPKAPVAAAKYGDTVSAPAQLTGVNVTPHASAAEGVAWANRVVGKPSTTATSALKSYTGSAYHTINGSLRSGHSGGSSVASIDAAMKPSAEPVVLHRGAGTVEDVFGRLNPNARNDPASLIGGVIWDDAYMSSSVGNRAAFTKEVMLEIVAPAGTKMAWLKPISHYSSENEMLIGRGTKMRVLSIEIVPSGYGGSTWKVRVEVVGQP